MHGPGLFDASRECNRGGKSKEKVLKIKMRDVSTYRVRVLVVMFFFHVRAWCLSRLGHFHDHLGRRCAVRSGAIRGVYVCVLCPCVRVYVPVPVPVTFVSVYLCISVFVRALRPV